MTTEELNTKLREYGLAFQMSLLGDSNRRKTVEWHCESSFLLIGYEGEAQWTFQGANYYTTFPFCSGTLDECPTELRDHIYDLHREVDSWTLKEPLEP